MPTQPLRIGMIVPSSNVTMETEVPELLRRQQRGGGPQFTFHSARLRLQQVTPEALQRMNDSAGDALDALCDAQVDAVMVASVVGVMFDGRAGIADTQGELAGRSVAAGRSAPVLTSAGALVSALKHLKAARITLLTPHRKELTTQVAATLAEYDIDVEQSRSLDVVDNVAVGRLDPYKLLALARQLDLRSSQALVLSACVQMPSLAVIDDAEQRLGLPVLSAATASVFELLTRLNLVPNIHDAGSLLRPGG